VPQPVAASQRILALKPGIVTGLLLASRKPKRFEPTVMS
jgi:hypothetical protein